MSRTRLLLAGSAGVCVLLGASSTAWSQSNRRFAPRGPDVRNELPAKITEGAQNEVIQPIPLTSQRLQTSLDGVHREIRDQVAEFKSNVKQVFPDEIDALSGTGKWRPEDRNALLKAIKSVDPAAVYEAWLQANPADTAGAEQVARQTAVKRTSCRWNKAPKTERPPRKKSTISPKRSTSCAQQSAGGADHAIFGPASHLGRNPEDVGGGLARCRRHQRVADRPGYVDP